MRRRNLYASVDAVACRISYVLPNRRCRRLLLFQGNSNRGVPDLNIAGDVELAK